MQKFNLKIVQIIVNMYINVKSLSLDTYECPDCKTLIWFEDVVLNNYT